MTTANVSHIPPKVPPPRKPRKKASVVAREAEAEDGFVTVTVEQCGVTLRVPVSGKIPITATDAFRAGDNYEGTKQIVGDEQWKLLRDAGMTVDGLEELAAKLREAWGN